MFQLFTIPKLACASFWERQSSSNLECRVHILGVLVVPDDFLLFTLSSFFPAFNQPLCDLRVVEVGCAVEPERISKVIGLKENFLRPWLVVDPKTRVTCEIGS